MKVVCDVVSLRPALLRSLGVLAALLLACDGGSVEWAAPSPCPATTTTCRYELVAGAGSTGQLPLTLRATGSMSGTFTVTATPRRPDLFTARVSPASIEASDNTPGTVTLTVDVAAAAKASDDGSIDVVAKGPNGGFSRVTVVVVGEVQQ